MRRALPAVLSGLLAFFLPVSLAAAEFDVEEFDVAFTDLEGKVATQAGSHPYAMGVRIRFDSTLTGEGGVELEEAAKDILVALPEGFVGNPTAVPRCATADFLTSVQIVDEGSANPVPNCPDAAAVGTIEVELTIPEGEKSFFGAVYNLEPPPGVAAKLGFWIESFPVTIELGVAEGPPYNITGGPTNITQTLEVVGSTLTVWGSPAAPAHDSLRGHCISPISGKSLGKCQAGISQTPFLTLPRSCSGPLETRYAVDSWQHPGLFHEGIAESEAMSGCGKLSFGPSISVQPTTTSAESASGLDIAISVNDEGMQNPDGVAQADIAAAEFRLPAGVTVNPSAAEGLGVCTRAQFEAASLENQGCPEGSKLGTLKVDTPVLENHTLKGVFYLAAQDDNPFGSLLAAYLMIRDEELGVFVSLPAKIETDEATGQIVTTVENMPPFPLERVNVQLRSGPRAPLVTPPSCDADLATPGNDPYTTEALLHPSSGAAPLKVVSSFQVTSGPGGGPCPPAGIPPFTPGFEAGSANGAASSYSPFAMRLTRSDGQQDLTRFSATLPPGVTGKIAGVAKCADAAIAAATQKSGKAELASPSCPASSLLGHVLGGAGVGTALTYVPGSLYLAGPYHGSPLSVAAIVPAIAGPFDVGTVVTRVALNLNPNTAQVEVDGAASDPIPHILKGIPLKLRDLRVYADRPSFTLNPTNCTPFATTSQIFGSFADPFNPADDIAVGRSSRYQASSCASLGFKPKVSLQLKGGTKRGAHPAAHATVTYPYPPGPGYANIAGAVVTLPPTEFIDNSHIKNPCTRIQFNANRCPPDSVLGIAKATTPLLDDPLEGPVYFRSNGGERLLPDLVADLHGQFRFIAVFAVNSKKARLRTRILNSPDVPVTTFTLDLTGGKKGLLVNSANLCTRKRRAKIELTGQNGREYNTEPVVKTSCNGKKKKKHNGRR
ncbi:MAG TPA: hypothetical protein VMS60_06910 [Solirubrobacterales bacterium]|nr:hypothetical protein [Solirubrobacterales bacterium]